MNRPIASKRPIALIGLSGAGKSTLGQALARRLGYAFLDTDALIALTSGRSVAQIFAEDGEERFRELEAAALRAALAEPTCVVATGGGIVLLAENRDLLRARAYVVWLDAPTEALIARLRAHDEPRPLLDGADPAARLEALRAARAGLYASVAELRLVTEERAITELCEEIVGALL
jgi:shikimate kinase